MKIALTSVSDIQNYGDILFSFIARQEIKKYLPNADFRFFTPTKCKIEGEQFYAYSQSAMRDYNPDAILTIGGEVIHKYDDSVWQDMYHNKVRKPSNVIFDWLQLDNVFKAWFSVGALDLDDRNSCASDEELAKLDFIGARGILSKKKLERKQSMFYNKKIQLVPDIGWIFPRYLKKTSISLKTISNKYNLQIETEKYIVVNINWTSIAKEKILEILEILSKFQKETGLKVIFIQVISSYIKVNFDFNNYFKEHPFGIYLDTLSLHETGLLLMNCRFFIGSSLHCAITSLASLKPAGLIHLSPLTKFQDLYGHMMMTDLLSQNWNDFSLILNKLYKFDQERKKVLKNYVCFMQSCFDYKLKELIKMMMQYEKIRTVKCKKKSLLSRAWRAIYKTPVKKMRNSLSAISNLILSLPIHKHEKANLLIVDNFEPSFLLTGFRVKEFNWLLTHIKNCKLLTFSSLIMNMSDWKKRTKSKEINWSTPMSRSAFQMYKKNYIHAFPHLKKSAFCYLKNTKYQANGAYLMFLYNAYFALSFLEKNNIPFIFTLFPGGGLRLNHPFSDYMLKSVFAHPMFRGVYVPQKIIYDYLLDNKLCPKEKIFFEYGGGFFQFTKDNVLPKLWYQNGKNTFDIGFVGYRYTKQGRDKGFDLFLHTAKRLVQKYPFIHFHCVGTNTLSDFDEDFSDLQNNLHMYPSQKADFFPHFFQKMDIMLSPNRVNILDAGAFDGFPLASEAGYFGVPLFCSDELHMNCNYQDGEELVIIQTNVDDIVQKIEYYIHNMKKLKCIGLNGQKKIQKLFDLNKQKKDREKFIRKYLNI